MSILHFVNTSIFYHYPSKTLSNALQYATNTSISHCVNSVGETLYDFSIEIDIPHIHIIQILMEKPDNVNLLSPGIIVEAELWSEDRPKRSICNVFDWC